MDFKEHSDYSLWLLKGLSINVDISDDESGMVMNILFKPRVEATEEMTLNRTIGHFAFQPGVVIR